MESSPLARRASEGRAWKLAAALTLPKNVRRRRFGATRAANRRDVRPSLARRANQLATVLDQLGLASKLRGSGPQRRCACPIHRGDARGRTFSVNLVENVFHCFDPACGKQGDVLDLWAALHQSSLREAALDLVQVFQLESAPKPGSEKRHG